MSFENEDGSVDGGSEEYAGGVISMNAGTVMKSAGTVVTNADKGVITDNIGVVRSNNSGAKTETNSGYVQQDAGTVSENTEDDIIETNLNNGVVAANAGIIAGNAEGGSIGSNKHVVLENAGTIMENTKAGIVETNLKTGTVTNNAGLIGGIDDKSGELIASTSNLGTITGNIGLVTENTGTIKDNNKGGVIFDNRGTVTDNNNGGDNGKDSDNGNYNGNGNELKSLADYYRLLRNNRSGMNGNWSATDFLLSYSVEANHSRVIESAISEFESNISKELNAMPDVQPKASTLEVTGKVKGETVTKHVEAVLLDLPEGMLTAKQTDELFKAAFDTTNKVNVITCGAVDFDKSFDDADDDVIIVPLGGQYCVSCTYTVVLNDGMVMRIKCVKARSCLKNHRCLYHFNKMEIAPT